MRVLFVLLLLFFGGVDAALPAHYMQTTEDAVIWVYTDNKTETVGNLHAEQITAVEPDTKDYYTFNFGFGKDYIDKGHLEPVQGRQRVKDSLGNLNKPLGGQNLITWKDTPVYNASGVGSALFGTLAENLRYSMLSRLKGRLNQIWYQIRIGERLAYIGALDVQRDSDIPILAYHHILRDEKNTRFRHTSIITSVHAFNNQMTQLRDMGYTTLTMYQLEDYLNNRANLPARSVVITFDDGLKSVSRYAHPILKQYGFKVTAFVISLRIKRHPQKWDLRSLQFMSISELERIEDVFDFQSHTHFLHQVDGQQRPILLSRNYHSILFDFRYSRRALRQFSLHVLYLSYPFGGYNATAAKAAHDAGFHLTVTMVKGRMRPDDNPMLLKRLYILQTDSLETMSRPIIDQPQG